MFCQTYFSVPLVIQSVIALMLATLSGCLSIRNDLVALFITLILHTYSYLQLLIKLPYSYHPNWKDAFIDIPSAGWSVDYIIVILIFLFIIELSLVKLLAVLLNPSLIIFYGMFELEKFTFFLNRNAHLKKYYAILFIVLTFIELYLWLPFVIEWSTTHCFIDDFISLTNPTNTYVTLSIVIADILLIDYFSNLDVSIIIKILFIAIAFYNTAICISLYVLYFIVFEKNYPKIIISEAN